MVYRVNMRRGLLRALVVLLVLLLTVWTVDNLTDTREHIVRLGSLLQGNTDGNKGDAISKADFVHETLSNGIYVDAYDGSSIRTLCNQTEWREGYFISCDSSIAGGIGNIKIGVVGCVRFAIAAGASIIMPSVHQRTAFGKMGESFDWDHGLDLDYLVDYEHLVSTLHEECPQLTVVETNSHAAETPLDFAVPSNDEKFSVNPKTLGPTKWGNVLSRPDHWRADLDKWIEKNVMSKDGHAKPSKDAPIRVDLLDTAFAWPPAADGTAFSRNFGRIVQFPRPIQQLSARALYNLYARVGIRDRPSAISRDAFLGAHLRTEGDAQAEGWQSYAAQLAHIREALQRHNLSALYVASGNQSQVALLQADLADLRVPAAANDDTHRVPVRVYQKWDLFDDEDAALAADLRWDQLGLVDMDIMLRASKFLGLAESSFSWTIALARHDWSRQDPYNHGVTFKDEFSTLNGNPGAMQLVPATVWL